PRASQHVFDLNIDLRPVEDAFAWINTVRHATTLESRLQRGCGLSPELFRADRLRRASRDVDLVFRESEGLQHEEGEVQNLRDLRFQLLRNAEQMRVVLREAAHPHQAVEYTGALVPVHRPELGIAHRKVPVAT